jgi:hypothetical protein
LNLRGRFRHPLESLPLRRPYLQMMYVACGLRLPFLERARLICQKLA